MSLLSKQTSSLNQEAAELLVEFERVRSELAALDKQRVRIINQLRQCVIDGAVELQLDAADCAIRTMVAISRGDDEAAEVFTIATARTALKAREADELLLTGTSSERP